MAVDDKRKLLKLLAEFAYDYKVDGFLLASGQTSDEYLDCKKALSRPEALASLGRLVMSGMDDHVEAVGGLTMGSDPIAIATAMVSNEIRPVRWFSVRKDAKGHGRKKLIEGDVQSGNRVVVVDDVVTTGGSTIQAIEKCREFGLHVVQVIVLVDREQNGGIDAIRSAAGTDVPVTALFTKTEVRQEWDAQRQTLRATA
jgi:orotate phosphoribosyltransferase